VGAGGDKGRLRKTAAQAIGRLNKQVPSVHRHAERGPEPAGEKARDIRGLEGKMGVNVGDAGGAGGWRQRSGGRLRPKSRGCRTAEPARKRTEQAGREVRVRGYETQFRRLAVNRPWPGPVERQDLNVETEALQLEDLPKHKGLREGGKGVEDVCDRAHVGTPLDAHSA
jgi:hypothetical protein